MDWVIVAATVVIACSAVVSAWLTWRLTRDNRTLLKAGTEPEVVAYAAPLGRDNAVFHLVLENVGQGPGRDVEFFVDASPNDFAGFNLRDLVPGRRRKVRSLLPQGGKVEVMMGVHHELFKNKGQDVLPPFYVEVNYANLRGLPSPSRRHRIDVSEFSGPHLVGAPDVEAADSLKKIEKNLEHFANGFKRLHVEMITTAEREAQEEEFRARWEQEAAAAEVAKEEAS